MKGSIWSVVALGVAVAFLPLIFSASLSASADALGSDVLDVVGTLSPVFGVLILVAAGGLLISLFSSSTF